MTGLQHIVVLLANQYKAMEGDLATCRFDCKSAILKKNPWRDFFRQARQGLEGRGTRCRQAMEAKAGTPQSP